MGPASSQETPVSELSLHDRLQKVQCLLQQAGLSPAEAMLGLTNPDVLDAANASPAFRRPLGSGDTDDLFHGHMGNHDSTHDADAGMHIGPDCSPVPNLTHGVAYDDLIILISPTPGPSVQASDIATDNSLPSPAPLSASQLSPLKVDPPSQCNDILVYATSPPALVSHALLQEQQQQQQQQDEYLVGSTDAPTGSGKDIQNSYDSFKEEPVHQSEALRFQQQQAVALPAASSMVAGQACDGVHLSHGGQPSASCQQSPASSADEVSQHGRKRSRSATICLCCIMACFATCWQLFLLLLYQGRVLWREENKGLPEHIRVSA